MVNEERDLKPNYNAGEPGLTQPAAEEQQTFFGFDRETLAKMPLYSLLYHVLMGGANGLKHEA